MLVTRPDLLLRQMRAFLGNIMSQRCRQLLAVVGEELRIVRAAGGQAAVEQKPQSAPELGVVKRRSAKLFD